MGGDSERGAMPLIKRTVTKGDAFSWLERPLKIPDAKVSGFPVKEPEGVREGEAIHCLMKVEVCRNF